MNILDKTLDGAILEDTRLLSKECASFVLEDSEFDRLEQVASEKAFIKMQRAIELEKKWTLRRKETSEMIEKILRKQEKSEEFIKNVLEEREEREWEEVRAYNIGIRPPKIECKSDYEKKDAKPDRMKISRTK